jgi:large subunit ribosomal protein L9
MARNVKVVFRADVRGIAQAGEVKTVAPGYARNYLFPHSLAFLATPAALRQWETERQGVLAHAVRLREESQAVGTRIDGLSISITKKISHEGVIFGSVGRQDLMEALSKEGITIEKAAILMDGPIKAIGTHSVPVRLSGGVQATLKINVIGEEGQKTATPDEEPK